MNMDNTDLASAVSGVGSDTFGEQWSMSLVEQLTGMEGRINRLRYLTATVLFLISTAIYIILLAVLGGLIWVITGVPEFILELLLGLLMIPILYPAYAITVKRLQDMNWGDGWTTFLQVYIATSAIWLVTPIGSSADKALDWITTILSIPRIVCYFAPGEKGPNRFGPDPLG